MWDTLKYHPLYSCATPCPSNCNHPPHIFLELETGQDLEAMRCKPVTLMDNQDNLQIGRGWKDLHFIIGVLGTVLLREGESEGGLQWRVPEAHLQEQMSG